MRFIATYSKGAIITDDYDLEEIIKKVHIKHIQKDLDVWGIRGTVIVRDINGKFVCKLNQRKVA